MENLYLNNLNVTAPNIMISVLSGMMTIGNDVVMNGTLINLTSNNSFVNVQESILTTGEKIPLVWILIYY